MTYTQKKATHNLFSKSFKQNALASGCKLCGSATTRHFLSVISLSSRATSYASLRKESGTKVKSMLKLFALACSAIKTMMRETKQTMATCNSFHTVRMTVTTRTTRLGGQSSRASVSLSSCQYSFLTSSSPAPSKLTSQLDNDKNNSNNREVTHEETCTYCPPHLRNWGLPLMRCQQIYVWFAYLPWHLPEFPPPLRLQPVLPNVLSTWHVENDRKKVPGQC